MVWSVAISSDGQRIVSGSDDKSVRVWDLSPHAESSLSSSRKAIHYICEIDDSSGERTGWVLSPDHQYLFFAPSQSSLPDLSNVLTIPSSAASSVDFTNAALGPHWQECYSPHSHTSG